MFDGSLPVLGVLRIFGGFGGSCAGSEIPAGTAAGSDGRMTGLDEPPSRAREESSEESAGSRLASQPRERHA